MPERRYVPIQGCSSCPNRHVCHEARQRVQDGVVPVGRPYECAFYESIRRETQEALTPKRPFGILWGRLYGFGSRRSR